MYALLEPLCGSARQPGHGIGKRRSPTFTWVYVRRQVRQNRWLQAGTLKALGRAKIESMKCLDSSRTSSPHIPHSRLEGFTKASDVADRLEIISPMAGARSKELPSTRHQTVCTHLVVAVPGMWYEQRGPGHRHDNPTDAIAKELTKFVRQLRPPAVKKKLGWPPDDFGEKITSI